MNEETSQKYHFSLYPRHIEFLDTINGNNRSGALQTVLDSVMNGQEQATRKAVLDNNIQWIAYGFFFFILTSLFEISIPWLISLILGILLLSYGGIGGIQYVLRRTKR